MNPHAQKYPIGIQDFRKLREEGYLYVDKTEAIYRLVTSGNYFFLSRPRRFGKSLLVNTLKELFMGSKELFEGLWIEKHWDWSEQWPVLLFPFASSGFQTGGLEHGINNMLNANAKHFQLTLTQNGIGEKLNELIKLLAARGKKVVLLIDEYDKPLIEYMERNEPEQVEPNRRILRAFYSVIKDNDEHIRFFFMTGVSKFAKLSLFSELNNLNNISLDEDYGDIAGITQAELEAYFEPRLRTIARHLDAEYPDLLAQAKQMYNGYSWLGENRVYNPFSLLNFLQSKSFRNFWIGTGSTDLLTRVMRLEGVFDPTKDSVSEEQLENYSFEGRGVIALMFQTGYLTIRAYDRRRRIFHLDYPNLEVKEVLLEYLLQEATQKETFVGLGRPFLVNLADCLERGEIETAMAKLNTVFAMLPYDLWPEMERRGESFFHAMFHVIFTLMGTYVQSEVHSANGRCDALVIFPQSVFVFEFKVDKPVEAALAQIEARDYLAPYKGSGRRLIAVGVSFSRQKKGIEAWRAVEETT